MSYLKPVFNHPDAEKNNLGLSRSDYEGGLSTLCAGCGHDSITAAIVEACFTLPLDPHRVAKMSGIGCSSKTPAYFLSSSHGFNSVHGRMPSVATGANIANRDLVYIGVSGDGDSASIGMGQFAHIVRRNVNMVYIVENNGCYGLTKGQDSATADLGSSSKKGAVNQFEAIDLACIALQLGATFVARSFSGDREQLVPLIKAAICHEGFAFIDILSPCVTFNNHLGSTKSYPHIRENNDMVALDFVPMREEIKTQYEEGKTQEVLLHDGSMVRLHKSDDNGHDIRDRQAALTAIHEHKSEGRTLTGLLYAERDTADLHGTLNTVQKPLSQLTGDELCPGSTVLDSINAGLR
ncbi:MAG: 2-oxoglutarate ferredoxin oxidoreductase subunit beta [Candidatus Azotimanducaceae bacterium]|jgi:2-oxoglutarate ferredoxin oxidoreductase subunit beta